MPSSFLVAIVDDDESVRESIPALLRECGFETRAFASAKEFLAFESMDETSCLILDVAMPDMNGPELLHELTSRGHNIPTIFITANADKGIRLRLLSQGATECLFKPFSDAALLAALDTAVRGS